MKRDTQKDEIEKLRREVEDLQRLARPEIPAADVERLRTEVTATAARILRASRRLAAHPAGAPSPAPLHAGLHPPALQDFHELHGDRAFGDDRRHHRRLREISRAAASWSSASRRAATPSSALRRNFGQAKPEGYRKALRVMQLAAKFGRPIFTFIDTPAPTPASTPRSAARPRPSPATCAKCRACPCPSS